MKHSIILTKIGMDDSKETTNVKRVNSKNSKEKSKDEVLPEEQTLEALAKQDESKRQLSLKISQAAGSMASLDKTKQTEMAEQTDSALPTPSVVVELTDASDLQKLLENSTKTPKNEGSNSHQSRLVMLCFSAKWCGTCVEFAPRLERIARRFNDVAFAKINVDSLPDVAENYEVTAVPTFVLLSDSNNVGVVVDASSTKIEQLLMKNGAFPADRQANANKTVKSKTGK